MIADVQTGEAVATALAVLASIQIFTNSDPVGKTLRLLQQFWGQVRCTEAVFVGGW